MGFSGLNYFAIVTAALASFLIGFVYYGLFGKVWMSATGKSRAILINGGIAFPMVITIVCQMFMAFVLAWVIGHITRKQVHLEGGIIIATFIWLGFSMTTTAVNCAWQRGKASLILIDGGHWLCVLLVQGSVIGVMGV